MYYNFIILKCILPVTSYQIKLSINAQLHRKTLRGYPWVIKFSKFLERNFSMLLTFSVASVLFYA